MLKFIQKVFGSKSGRDLKKLNPHVGTINGFFDQYKSLSNDELRSKTTPPIN